MLDVLIVGAFAIYSLGSGLAARKAASRGLEDYFLAGRTLPGWQAGMSMAATQFAADTPLLVAGLVASGGIFLLWRLWIYGLAFLFLGFVLAASWRRAGVITDAELTEVRYGGRGALPLRVIKAVYFGLLINSVVLAMVLSAAVRVAEVFLPWHEWLPPWIFEPLRAVTAALPFDLASGLGRTDAVTATTDNLISIGALVVFTFLYSATGGLRSVVRTDVVQLAVALVGTFVYAGMLLHEVGGLSGLTGRIVELYGPARASELLSFAPPTVELLLPFAAVVGLQWIFQMNSDGTGYLAQRVMACSSERESRVATVWFAWLQIFVRSLPWLIIAAGLLVLHPLGDAGEDGFVARREMLYALGVEQLLPPGVRGLMLTGMLAALASTVDTHLNWGASYFTRDVWERLVCRAWLRREPGRREMMIVARGSLLLILGVALLVMANLGSIQTAWHLSLLFGAGMGGVLLLRWLWEGISVWSELAAMVVSFLLAPLLLVVTGEDWVRLAVMGTASTAAAVVAALVRPPDRATVSRFYAAVRPPGLWPRSASAAGEGVNEPLHRLRAGLIDVALVGGALFALLYGAGRLLLPAPDGTPALPILSTLVGTGLLVASRMRRRPEAGTVPAETG